MPELDTELERLRSSLKKGESVFAIHYSCGNIFGSGDELPAISAISVVEITANGAGAHNCFSMTDSVVVGDADSAKAETRERVLLENFYDFAARFQIVHYIHWNMNKSQYSFQAIAKRFYHLTGKTAPVNIPVANTHDLDDLLTTRYGEGYVRHPKMHSLFQMNGYYLAGFLGGLDESEKLGTSDFASIERSSDLKATLIAKAFRQLLDGTLTTSDSAGYVEFSGASLDAVRVVLELGERFLDVQRELTHRHAGRSTLTVTDEYDAQDLFRSLLRIFFRDVRPEEWTPSVAGASARVDFWLPEFQILVELKHSRSSMTSKSVGEELIVDRTRYSGADRVVRRLVCLVFDPSGQLRNPRGLERDLSQEASTQAIAVTVRIFDR